MIKFPLSISEIASMFKDRDVISIISLFVAIALIFTAAVLFVASNKCNNKYFFFLVLSIIPFVFMFIYRGYFIYSKEKKEENQIFNSIKMEIICRKQNPQYEIAVNLQSLKDRYPFTKKGIFLNVLKRLSKEDGLFDGYDHKNMEFYYKGSLNKKLS